MLVALRKAVRGLVPGPADEPSDGHRQKILATLKHYENVLASAVSPAEAKAAQDRLLATWRRLALAPGGFLTRELRKRIWPILLGFTPESLEAFFVDHRLKPQTPGYRHRAHPDDDQVQRDVDRSLNPDMWHDAPTLHNRRKRRKSLYSLVHAVLCSAEADNVELHYYQGFHDVAAVFLLTTGVHAATPLLVRASATYFQEPMRTNFDSVLAIFNVLYPLLQTQDTELYAHIMASGVDPYFALPWMITWFAHHIKAFDDVCRLYDILLCSHPLFSLYLSAALVLHHRTRLLACPCDYAEMHSVLSKLVHSMPIEGMLVPKANGLLQLVPPAQLLEMSRLANGDPIPQSCFTTYPFPHQSTAQETVPASTSWLEALAPRHVQLVLASMALAVLASVLAMPILDQLQ
ncbi:hypothetical protein SPRG_10778 [Saprolegnia parasitica CBS 223.65]|uniref:Rab-GAP TBC domain-containing protein n=1 Tax=Saprolegnia parasitica (strain CBS 223.65) TaxID=695850 RepID=A0A067BZ77_SAPPC|nr:hypothetical protein SPRG_10778 [Saprolegnia parasitica CBS 223.65]KDO23583.1 hypothetical protein SPRG_10778 [Saprolegnia parasitica CBS 223.65]|eukprot:XP_012205731.1 hypothetical protein SPRG_10778 [Saprolegnia parasitica CBS 223.65]